MTLVLRSLPLLHAFYTSMYLEVIAVLHYNNHDGDIHVCVIKACISSKCSKCINAIKRILYTTAMYISSSSFVYLCISLCSDACLKSSALRMGVKTLHITMQYNKWLDDFDQPSRGRCHSWELPDQPFIFCVRFGVACIFRIGPSACTWLVFCCVRPSRNENQHQKDRRVMSL